MASSSEAQFLLQEYADLKRLIDSHKSRKLEAAASCSSSYRQTRPHSRKNSNQFLRNGVGYTRNHPLPPSAPSLYALNRTAGPRPGHKGGRTQVPFTNPNSHSFPNRKSSLMGHQLLPSQISSTPGQSSRTVYKFQVRTQNSAVGKVPSSFLAPDASASKETLSHLSNISAQILANNLGTVEKPQPAASLKMYRFGLSQEKPSQLKKASAQTAVTSKLAATKRPQITSALKLVATMDAVQGKPSQIRLTPAPAKITSTDATTLNPPAMVIPKNVPSPERGLRSSEYASLKTTFLSGKSSAAAKSRGSLKHPQLKYKFVRPDYSLKLPGSSETPLPVSASPARKASSKYKLVATTKKNSSKVKSPVFPATKSLARRQTHATKYSWSLNCSQEPKRPPVPVGRNVVKSRYRLSRSSVGVSPKLVRRVNKYSVKYMSSRQRNSPRECKPQFTPRRSFMQRQTKGKSDLVVIGGILYKSSKTKLSRTADAKMRNSGARYPANQQIVNVRGERFSMDLNRKVLKRLSMTEQKSAPAKSQTSNGPSPAAKSKGLTRIDIGGETYIQTRPGVLVRSNTNQLRSLANRVVNRSIFRLRASKGKSQQYCLFYNKFGKCNNKEKGLCPYIHDSEKIAICKRFLRGDCTVDRCPFSHTVCRSKMPVCTFFLHGRCNSDCCNYRHVNVNPNADICLDFAKGYCPLGEKCKNWHVSVCPQFEQTGKCDKANKCPLKHQRRVAKGQKRSAVANQDSISTASDSRPSADEIHEDEPSTSRRRRCPSFILLESDSDAGTPPSKVQKVLDVPLQIKPDFLKLS